MSLILPPTAAPSQPANPPSSATARSEEQGQSTAGSFSEVLSRSQAPAGEISGKITVNAAKPAPARRQASDHKAAAPADMNAVALAFAALESRVVKATPSGAAAAASDSAVAAPATAALADRSASTPAPTDRPLSAKEVSTAAFAEPESRVVKAAPSGAAAAATDSAVAAPATAALADRSASTPAPTDRPLSAKEVSTATDAQAALENAAAAVGKRAAIQATQQAKLNPASESSATELDAGKIAGQLAAPNTSSPDPTSKRADKAGTKPDKTIDASADLTPAAAHSTFKLNAPATAPSVETAALPLNPMHAAAQSTAGVASSNAPVAAPLPSLIPEVGSSEWGKALGQQMIQMSHAGAAHQVAELQLNPPGLGPLKVTLSMDDHQMQAVFASSHPSVRAAVEAALPQLRTSLADSGISLGNTSINSGSQQQTAFAQSQSEQPEPRSYRGTSMPRTSAGSDQPAAPALLRRSNGITVDTYV